LDELFDAVETLAMGLSATGGKRVGRRLAILTNGGGIGVMATDSLIEAGGQLAKIAPEAIARLDAFLPPTWSKGNPVDIIGDATAKRYADSLSTLLDDTDADAFLVLNCPSAVGDSYWAAQAVVETVAKHPRGRQRPLLTSWLGEGAAAASRALFENNRIPTYDTPGDAIRAFMHLVQYSANQDILMQTPDSTPEEFTADEATVRAIIDRALGEGRGWLTEYEAKQVLAAYTVPVVETRRVTSPEEAAAAARAIGGRVALKILSADITHKSDIGGVVLGIADPEQVRVEAEGMLERVRLARPDATIEGFTVQQMAVRADHRHDRRPPVRSGDPVRPGRDQRRGGGRSGAGAAAAEPRPGPRVDLAHAGLSVAQGLSQPAGGGDRRYRSDLDQGVATGDRFCRDHRP